MNILFELIKYGSLMIVIMWFMCIDLARRQNNQAWLYIALFVTSVYVFIAASVIGLSGK